MREDLLLNMIKDAIEKELKIEIEKEIEYTQERVSEIIRSKLGIITCSLLSSFEIERDKKRITIQIKNDIK